MQVSEAMVRGTLKADGSLELAEKPDLPPGPVQVLLRTVPPDTPPQDSWWEYLQQARKQIENSGRGLRSREEIDAEIEDLRSEDNRLEDALRP